MRPPRACVSSGFSAAYATRIRAWPGPGSGIGRSTIRRVSGSPAASASTARIVLLMAVSWSCGESSRSRPSAYAGRSSPRTERQRLAEQAPERKRGRDGHAADVGLAGSLAVTERLARCVQALDRIAVHVDHAQPGIDRDADIGSDRETLHADGVIG